MWTFPARCTSKFFARWPAACRFSSVAEKEITFSEMLPGATDAWLADSGGEKYTSEFRLVIVDLKARSFSEEYKKRYARAATANR